MYIVSNLCEKEFSVKEKYIKFRNKKNFVEEQKNGFAIKIQHPFI